MQPGHDARRHGELTSSNPKLCTKPCRVGTVCLPSNGGSEVGVEGGSQAIMEVVWGVHLP